MADKKESIAQKAPAKKRAAKGDTLTCEVCGLSVVVDEACGCAECEILCCGKPMKAT